MQKQSEIRNVISSRLALARENAGLSQAQVAKMIGIQRPSISEIEAGRRKVSAEELVQFSNIYKVDIGWLSGQEVENVDVIRDKFQLAARNFEKFASDDREKIISILTMLQPNTGKDPHE